MSFETAFRLTHPHGLLVAVRIPEGRPGAEALARLHPEERAAAEPMAEIRCATWVAGRLAIAEALEAIGAPRCAVLSDDRGAPRLPDGFAGSISHKRGLAVALAARDEGWRLGVDLEDLGPERLRIAPKVLIDAELAAMNALPEPQRWPDMLARFSLKEAIYKALDPFVRRYVEFKEAEIDLGDRRPATGDRRQALTGVFFQNTPATPAQFVAAQATLALKRGEGPFEVQLTWRRAAELLATARIRRR